MAQASKYWCLFGINQQGQCTAEEMPQAQEFFRQKFADLYPELRDPGAIAPVEVDDGQVQRQLFQYSQSPVEGAIARLCLLCYISHTIRWSCHRIAERFGSTYGFTAVELLILFLNGSSRRGTQPEATSFMDSVLQTFDPEKSLLGTWTDQLVRHDTDLNSFLFNCGLYLISDWALLNKSTPSRLQKILAVTFRRSTMEVQQAGLILESYHHIYRGDRLRQKSGAPPRASRCLPPTEDQLRRMADWMEQRTGQRLTGSRIFTLLQDFATCLRQVATKKPQVEEWNEATHSEPTTPVDEAEDFLKQFHNSLIQCLDDAIQTIIRLRQQLFQQKSEQKAQNFITALQLLYGEGLSMGEIAPQLHLGGQTQVTRLLQLNDFYEDVKREMIKRLRDCIDDLAQDYMTGDRLESFDQLINEALGESIDEIINEARNEMARPRHRPPQSLFAQRLCPVLNSFL